ncbi:MAG: hypothetical protein JW900_03475 [Anaerolineae bacterium]|nr:hypothetical protein [Anaerolineae bacterium]
MIKAHRILPLLLLFGFLLCGCESQGPMLIFSPAELPPATVGQPYQVTIVVSENDTPVGDMFVEDGSLPPGLAFVFLEGADSAEISGTPTEAGTFEFTVGAWCFGTNVSGDTGQQLYTLVVE